jgi:hypothetical protein
LYVAVSGIIPYPFCFFWFCLRKLTINTEGIFFQKGAGYAPFNFQAGYLDRAAAGQHAVTLSSSSILTGGSFASGV